MYTSIHFYQSEDCLKNTKICGYLSLKLLRVYLTLFFSIIKAKNILNHCSNICVTKISVYLPTMDKIHQVGELSSELQVLPKRALLAAAFITYLSAAPEDQRRDYLRQWRDSIGVDQFDLRRFLCTESEQLIWKGEGLPSDDLSMENALVILQVLKKVEKYL